MHFKHFKFNSKKIRLTLGVSLILFFSKLTFAQINTIKIETSKPIKTGELFIQAFEGSKPVQSLILMIDNKKYQTNSAGSLLIELTEGPIKIFLPQSEKTLTASIFENQQTYFKIEIEKKELLSTSLETPDDSETLNSTDTETVSSKVKAADPGEILVLAPQSRVSFTALLELRKKNSGVSEILGSEQMARQGDSDAASSLRRVTGLTLLDGKYVFVRGLGDRYSSVQLNGFSLPSPEPARKVVPLDLFPVSILDQVQVQKSYASSFPGEFGGGLIQLETKSKPQETFVQVGTSVNYEPSDQFLTYAGGKTDYLGQDDGTRQMPSRVKAALLSGKKLVDNGDPTTGFSKEELRALGIQFKKNYSTFERKDSSLPNLQLGLGLKKETALWKWGVTGSGSYNTDQDVISQQSSKLDVPRPGELVLSETSVSEIYEIERKLSLATDLSAEYDSTHQLRLTLLSLRHSTDETQIEEFSGPGVNDFSRQRTRTEWVERNLNVQQVQTQHKLGPAHKMALKWGRSQIRREAPDQKEVNYRKVSAEDPYQLDAEVSGNIRTFNDLAENSQDLAVNFEGRYEKLNYQLGLGQIVRSRESDTFRFQFVKDYLAGNTPDLTLNPDQIFSNENDWILVNQTGTADSYSGSQITEHAFLDLKYAIHPQWELSSGLRIESSEQTVKTYFYYSPDDTQSLGENKTLNQLPAYSLKWTPSDKWRLRLAYGETIAKPDFRELSTVRYIDDETGYEAKGNTALVPTIILNLDQRIEYYFAPDEFVSVGLFYKKFENPIEDVFQPLAGSLIKVPQNALSAENRGLEFESRVSLRRWARGLRRWSILGNISWIDSEVQLNPETASQLTSEKRALQGQSPYVVNLGLFYDRPLLGFQGSLMYNVLGRRITEVGTDQRPDIFEEPIHQVDLNVSKRNKSGLSFGFKIRNLIDPKIQSSQGGQTIRSYQKGRSYSAGLTWTL